jgi:protein SCO1/2
MTHFLSKTQLRYVFLSGLVVTLLVGGFLIGSTLNTALQPSPQAAAADDSNPGGGALVDPPHRVDDFTLTSHTGDSISLHEMRGRAVLMFFGYTHCPDVCPTTLADYRRVKQALGDDADDVNFVFVSVDGVRDTPDVLTDYLSRFDPDFIGMTGDEATLRQIGAEYGLMFQLETVNVGHEHDDDHEHDLDDENYFVQHTSPSFLIDRDGYLRMVYFYGTEPETIAEGIRQVLR